MALQRNFRYETLLRIRRRQEDLKAQAFAAARRDVDTARSQRNALHFEQRRALETAGSLSQAEFDASDVRRYYQYERHLARLGDAKDADIRELEEMAESRRQELEEASKGKRIVEKLKERHGAAVREAYRKLEQDLADEVGSVHAALAGRRGVTPRRGQKEGKGL